MSLVLLFESMPYLNRIENQDDYTNINWNAAHNMIIISKKQKQTQFNNKGPTSSNYIKNQQKSKLLVISCC